MKKVFSLLACATVAFASCTLTKEDGTSGPVIVNPDDVLVGKTEVLDPDTQKVKLEQVGTKLMDVFPASEYEDLVEVSEVFASHCDRYYNDEDYDWTAFFEAFDEDWQKKMYESIKISDNKWETTMNYYLSNCTGVLTLGHDAAEYAEGKDIKVILEDVDGEDWEMTLVSKDLKKVFIGEWYDIWYDYNWNDDTYEYEQIENEDKYELTVEIPNSLTFDVKKGGKFFASVSMKFDYNISQDGLNYEQDRVAVITEVKIDDLALTLEKASVNAATGEIELKQSLTKSGMLVFSQSLSSKVLVELEEEDGEIVDAKVNESSANYELNILGELQFKGACSDLEKLAEKYEQDIDSERTCKGIAKDMTELLQLNVYYDCTSTVQARIEFEPMSEEDEYYGNEYYWIEPVIVFEDGSRYRFEKYFKERDFRDLIEKFDLFVYDYEDMVDSIY